jgi:transcriptional regulator with XRE-family HTH domain
MRFDPYVTGSRIRQARLEKGLTQPELAAVCAFSMRSLQNWETGVSIPYKHFTELSKVLDKQTNWFLYGGEAETLVTPSRFEELSSRVDAVETRQEEILSLLRELRELPKPLESPPTEGA